jgi:hypothetical protein
MPKEKECVNPYNDAMRDTTEVDVNFSIVQVPSDSFAPLKVGTVWKYYVNTFYSTMHDGYTDCYSCEYRIIESTSSSIRIRYLSETDDDIIDVSIENDSLLFLSGSQIVPIPVLFKSIKDAISMSDSSYCFQETYDNYGTRLFKTGIGCVYDVYEYFCSGCSNCYYYCLTDFNGKPFEFDKTVSEYHSKESLIPDSLTN